jgi:hypothetical protein
MTPYLGVIKATNVSFHRLRNSKLPFQIPVHNIKTEESVEDFVVQRYDSASLGNWFRTFRGNAVVSSSYVKCPKRVR